MNSYQWKETNHKTINLPFIRNKLDGSRIRNLKSGHIKEET